MFDQQPVDVTNVVARYTFHEKLRTKFGLSEPFRLQYPD